MSQQHSCIVGRSLPARALHGVQVALHLQWRIHDRLRLGKCVPEDLNHFALKRDPPLIQAPGVDNNKSRLQMQRNLDAMKRARGQGSADDARMLLAQLTSLLSVAPTLIPQRVTLADGVASLDVAVADAQMQSTLKAQAASVPGATFAVDAGSVVRLSLKATR